jgi:hypothetical protein
MSLSQNAYNASLAYGKFEDYNSIFVLSILGIGLIWGAYYLYSINSKYVPTSGTVLSIDNPNNICAATSDAKGNVTYECLFTVSYNINGNKGTTQINQSGTYPVVVGQNIGLVYDSTAPEYPPTLPKLSSWVTILMVVIGLVCFFGAYTNYKLVTTPTLAPVVAAQGALSIGTGVSRGIGNIIREI